MRRMTKPELKRWMKKWESVRAVEIEQIRNASEGLLMMQTAAMMRMATALDWTIRDENSVRDVRKRWDNLREAFVGR